MEEVGLHAFSAVVGQEGSASRPDPALVPIGQDIWWASEPVLLYTTATVSECYHFTDGCPNSYRFGGDTVTTNAEVAT